MKVILHACFLLFSGNILKNGGSTDYVMYLLDPFHPIGPTRQALKWARLSLLSTA